MADASLDLPESDSDAVTNIEKAGEPARPMIVYTRPQLLLLQKSPLVQLPPDMPPLKDWFGVETDLQSPGKKDSESSTSGRERRFPRRDTEDFDIPTRPSFRSTLSQPSPMGNFKHQSTRASERDHRDRDVEKERERDIRDKEGQERLRNLSDKYDRDRLASPVGSTGLRGKERDLAPHLAAGSSRLGAAALGTAASRRAELRETPKKKAGETSEDWRRGAEPPRPGREDRTEASRRDRSRARDSSRSRREKSATRREKDSEGDDDSRRWRDDDKRERRLAARDKGSDTTEPRWTVVEERDNRSKRSSGRDRRTGDESKDKDERKEKEKEKEPAWMEAYVPSTLGAGILGAKAGDELDGIQVFKKGMKEKEDKSKGAAVAVDDNSSGSKPEKGLDEIQMFKLMMEREKHKKVEAPDSSSSAQPLSSRPSAPTDSAVLQMGAPASGHNDSFPSSIPFSAPSDPSASNSEASRSLLSLLTSSSNGQSGTQSAAPPKPQGSRFFPNPLNPEVPAASAPAERRVVDLTAAQSPPPPPFNPPQGSRLLAFGSRTATGAPTPPISKPQTPTNAALHHVVANSLAGFPNEASFNQRALAAEGIRRQQGFSPFEEQVRLQTGIEDFGNHDRRNLVSPGDRSAYNSQQADQYNDATGYSANSYDNPGYAAGKGSRFAKFFDGKREQVGGQPLGPPKPQVSMGFGGSPPVNPRSELTSFGGGAPGESRGMEDLFAMLNNSAQGQRGSGIGQSNALPFGNERSNSHSQHQQQLLQQQQQQQHQQHQQRQQQSQQQLLSSNSRLEALYESRLDDRNFQADGLVPGLRSAPPPRPRENSGMFHDHIDDAMHFNGQRLPQQQRGLDLYSAGGAPSMYSHQQSGLGRNQAVSQQGHYRGPSPIQSQSALLAAAQQRLPPGLANLGGRPPHEPGQFISSPMTGHQQQSFQNYQSNGGFSGGGQMRGPPGSMQVQNQLGHNSMAGNMGQNMDVRSANQAQLMALGGNGSMDLRVRGFGPQQGLGGQGVGPQHGQGVPAMDFSRQLMRQQQQQQYLQSQQQQQSQHMMPGMHQGLQHNQSGHGLSSNQPHDLMALLMAGHRE